MNTRRRSVKLCLCTTIAAALLVATLSHQEHKSSSAPRSRRSLFFRLRPLFQLHPRDAFVAHTVCVDATDCDGSVISFVGSDVTAPQPNEFRYNDNESGPDTLKGVFWFKGQIKGYSILSSFAENRLGFGVGTGELNGDDDQFAMVARPRGDHTWAFSGQPSGISHWYNDITDWLYLFDLKEGTIAEPLGFTIYPEFRIFFDCVRYSMWQLLSDLFITFSMDLLTDETDSAAQAYSSSVIWNRRTSYLFGLWQPASGNYDAIQIIDGNGDPLQPAYDDFVAEVKEEFDNELYFYGLQEERLNDYVTC